MRLTKLRTCGLSTAFRREEVTIDFDALGSGIVCLVGGNGSGKTTLLELSGVATLFRNFVSYGESFNAHVVPGIRDAFSELTWEMGGSIYRALVQADPEFGGGRGKTEAYLYCDGAALAGPLVRDFDTAIAKHLPPLALFCASVFAAQGGEGSFFALPKATRKDLFVKMLGLEHLQALAEQAHDRAQSVAAAAEALRDQIADTEPKVARCHELRAALRQAQADRDEQNAALSTARTQLDAITDRLRAATDEVRQVAAERQRITEQRTQIDRRMAEVHVEILVQSDRIDEAAETLAEREVIERASTELQTLDASMAVLADRERQLRAELEPLDQALAAAAAKREGLVAEYRRLENESILAKAAEERTVGYDAAAAFVERLDGRLTQIAIEISALELEDEQLRTQITRDATTAHRRAELEAQRRELTPRISALDAIDLELPVCAVCPLTEDARSARDRLATVTEKLEALPPISADTDRQAKEVTARLKRLRGDRETRQRAVDAARAALAERGTDRTTASRLPELTFALAANVATGQALKRAIERDTARANGLRAQLAVTVHDQEQHKARRSEIAPVAAKAAALAVAQAQHTAAEQAKATALARQDALAAEQQALPRPPAIEPLQQAVTILTTQAEDAAEGVRRLDEAWRSADTRCAELAGELRGLGDPSAELRDQQARLAQIANEAEDWALLAKGLGRDGVQALEIDAAGPGVTTLANDLLATCYGPRFSLAIETTALKKDGGQKEVFDVRILDAEAGREARRGSGGEMVILEEALRLAIAIYNAQRSGYDLRTLWRDETAGALSPENADRYVQMLRRAREIGGFYQVLFVAHAPDVWQQADRRLFVQDGRVTTDGESLRQEAA